MKNISEKNKNLFSTICTSVIGISLVFTIGYFTATKINESKKNNSNNTYTAKLDEIYSYMYNNWLYGGTKEDLQEYLCNLMINGLMDDNEDPYTFYTSTKEAQGLDTSGSGIYGFTSSNYSIKVGSINYGGKKIINLYDGTFKKAGFQVGDVLIAAKKANQSEYTYFQDYSPSSFSSICSPYDDKKETSVSFKYVRDNQIYELDAKLGDYSEVPVSVVSSSSSSKSLGLSISTFLGDSNSGYPASLLEKYIDQYLNEYGTIENLVLDCRDNGGGYIDQAYNMACLFLPKGSVVYQIGDKSGNITSTYKNNSDPKYDTSKVKNIKIILNGNSASATELFTKALKDNSRCTVYGSQSYGKGIGQSVISLQNGGVLRITTMKVYGPNGDSIHQIGITPDVKVDDFNIYATNLVNACFISEDNTYDSGYRLTYTQETNVIDSIKRIDSSITSNSYTDVVSTFQTRNGLNVNGVYDSYTLYMTYKYNLDEYYNGYNKLYNDVYNGII